MDTGQLFATLIGTGFGAALVIFNDRLRVRMERRIRRGDALMQYYADFRGKLESALREKQRAHLTEVANWRDGTASESSEDKHRRLEAVNQLRHCADHLSFFEPDRDLKRRIEELMREFEQPIAIFDNESPPEEYFDALADYWKFANKLRAEARAILEAARQKHKLSLKVD